MKRWLLAFVFVLLYALTAFFGLGPVLFADGSMQERLWTLLVVLLIFAVLTVVLLWILRRMKSRG